MSEDIAALVRWIHICMWIAAVCTTLVPLVYAFSPWFRSRLGWLFMIQGAAFAVAIDVTLLFQYWYPKDVMVIFWINAATFTLVAGATLALAILIFRMNHMNKLGKAARHDRRES